MTPSPERSWSETIAIAIVIVSLLLTAIVTGRSFRDLQESRLRVRQSLRVLLTLGESESAMKDAETGQRGFIITGDDDYLEPFDRGTASATASLTELKKQLGDTPNYDLPLAQLDKLFDSKISELRQSIEARRSGDLEAALKVLKTNQGKLTMDEIRRVISDVRDEETSLLNKREQEAGNSYRTGRWTSILTSLILFASVASMLYLLAHNRRRAGKAAEQISVDRERLRVTLSSIGDAVIATDVNGQITNMNPVAEALTGWDSEHAFGQPLAEVFKIVNESTRLTVESPALRALREGVIVGLANHTVLIAKNGNEIPIDDSAAPIRDVDGDVVGSVLVFRDISHRKRDEALLKERNRLVALRADVGESLGKAQPTEDILQEVCQALVGSLEMAFARIWTMDAKGEALELKASAGLYTHLDGPHSRVPIGEFKIGRIAANRKSHLSNSVTSDPEVSNHEWARKEGMIAFAGYPLLVEQQVVGVVAMFARHPLTEGIMKELEPIADGIAQFINRRQVEQRLRDREDQLQMTLDSAELGTWHIDSDASSVTTDARFQEIFGTTTAVLTYEQAFACLHPDDREAVQSAIEAALRPLDPLPYAIEYRVVHRDGPIRWVFAKGRGNFSNGVLNSFHGTVADITERKRMENEIREAEAQFRFMADNIPQLAWIADPGSAGQIQWFNQNWYNYTGTTLEQMRGTGWHLIHHPEHAERVIEKFSNHVRDNLDWEDTFPLRGKDGQYRWFLSRMKVIRNDDGVPSKLFGTNTDVTEQIELAEQLRQNAAALSESDRRKNEFLATLAHELRNPLAPIKNAVQLMGMSELDADNEMLRQTMARQVEQLVRLIDDLMDISRISRGKIVLRREVIDLASIVDAAVEASSTFIAETGQQLTVDCPRDSIFVSADPARITQVISNLLNNSAKYSSAGCQIDLSIQEVQGNAQIEVRDNGIGIAQDRLQDIFRMFSQINDSLERGAAGLGIGLTLVKTLVELHGGTVEARSAGLNQGSQFVISLPTTNKSQFVNRPATSAPQHDMRRCRILIVEDQRALRFVLTKLLTAMGHEVQAVEGGKEALATLASYHPELIFSDISMPGMNGYELVTQLKQRDDLKGTYFVAMSGFGQQSDRDQSILSGFDEHMVKPVDVDRLHDLFARFPIR